MLSLRWRSWKASLTHTRLSWLTRECCPANQPSSFFTMMLIIWSARILINNSRSTQMFKEETMWYLDGLKLQVKAGRAGGGWPGPHSRCWTSRNQKRDKAIRVGGQHVSKRLGVLVLQEALQKEEWWSFKQFCSRFKTQKTYLINVSWESECLTS